MIGQSLSNTNEMCYSVQVVKIYNLNKAEEKLRGCLVSSLLPKISVTSNVWTHVWSIKYRLITKLIAQLTTNLRDESFKPNQFMI